MNWKWVCHMISFSPLFMVLYILAGACTKTEEEEGHSIEEDTQSFHGAGVCKWFNVRMGFGFLSMNSREGEPLEAPIDVFVHQVAHNFFRILPLTPPKKSFFLLLLGQHSICQSLIDHSNHENNIVNSGCHEMIHTEI